MLLCYDSDCRNVVLLCYDSDCRNVVLLCYDSDCRNVVLLCYDSYKTVTHGTVIHGIGRSKKRCALAWVLDYSK